ncbi:endonuclease/exonuclease/phosphatase family protein [Dactylosporangium sp. CA-139066]|uniref:endonuclease/exonuclease/phosphatase family protein n=1 Tax=Dactylosporangium sp. CA-139066 TaxID=3239930 RepID=UPI003D8ECD2A
MSLTLMTYNIKNGGGGRLGGIGDVIAGAAPDVVAVQELRGEPDVGAATGLRQLVARSWRGQPVGLLIRPELPVLAAGRIARPFFHAAAWARIATPLGPLTVVSAHLFPYWGWVRRVEAGWLAAFVRRQGETVLLGDLNTRDERDGRVLARLARCGLVDVFRRCGAGPGWTVPTTRGGGAGFPAPLRLDYVLATPGVAGRFSECRVVTGGAAEAASDHYPLVARAA